LDQISIKVFPFGRDPSGRVMQMDNRINPVKGTIQRVAAKKKVIVIAANPFRRIPYFRITTHVPMKQRMVQTSIE
jgi:hypothetical protein